MTSGTLVCAGEEMLALAQQESVAAAAQLARQELLGSSCTAGGLSSELLLISRNAKHKRDALRTSASTTAKRQVDALPSALRNRGCNPSYPGYSLVC